MTLHEFKALPFLLMDHQLLEVTGYHERTMEKLVECAHLLPVLPAGATERRFRKVQVAQLAGLDWEEEALRFWDEPMLMGEKSVTTWTGYAGKTIDRIATAGGLTRIRPAGIERSKFRKVEVAALLGLERFV